MHLQFHTPEFDTLYRQAVLRGVVTDRVLRGMQGFGDVTNPATDIATAGAIASSTAGILIGTGAAASGGTIAAMGTLAGPIGAVAGALIGIFMQIVADSGCGQTCIISSDYANKVTAILQQNLQAWQSSGHTESEQKAALANVDYAFAQLNQLCGNPQLGNAGKRCISERLVRGGTAPWCPLPGHTGCDYYTVYRDPIANDPSVVPDTVVSPTVASVVNNALNGNLPVVGTTDSGLSSLLSGNGLLVVAILVGALVIASS